MPEHRIRLAGAWELFAPGRGADVARRLNLPTTWPSELAGPLRILRRFGSPPIDPAIEVISLEFLGVPGLRRIDLNGVEFPGPPAGSVDWVVPLDGPLLARNTLILDVAIEPPGRVERLEGWGSIALVITPMGESRS